MQTSSPMQVKPLGQTTAGELIKLKIGPQAVFALTLGVEGPNVDVGTLQPYSYANGSEVPHPVHFRQRFNAPSVISFGHDWVLEPILGAESYPGNHAVFHTPGRMVLDGNHYLALFFPVPNSPEVDAWFDLTTNAFADQPDNSAVPLSGWRIWQSEAERARPGATPLVELVAG